MRSIIAGLMLSSSIAFSQTSFDSHFDLAKHGKLGLRESKFAAQCGITRSQASITYGRSLDQGWNFQRVNSVGQGRKDAEMDFLGNAELWSIAGKPRLLNVWFLVMDIGSSNNELFCMDEQGRVVRQESLNVYEPVEGDEPGWRHLMTTEYPLTGKPHLVTDVFLNKNGAPIPAPKLSQEDRDEASGHSSRDLAKDLIAKISTKDK